MREMYDQQYLSVQQKLDERTLEKQQRSKLSHEITDYLQSVLDGAVESNVFYKTMLHSLTVYADRSAELKLMYLPHVFRFQYDSEGNHLAQRQHLC